MNGTFDYLTTEELREIIKNYQNKIAKIVYGELDATKEDLAIDRRDLHDMSRELCRRNSQQVVTYAGRDAWGF